MITSTVKQLSANHLLQYGNR